MDWFVKRNRQLHEIEVHLRDVRLIIGHPTGRGFSGQPIADVVIRLKFHLAAEGVIRKAGG